MCCPPYEIRRRGRDDDHVCFTRKADVIESVPRAEDVCVDGATGNCFEGDGPDELARTTSHHDVDFSPCLCKQTRQPH